MSRLAGGGWRPVLAALCAAVVAGIASGADAENAKQVTLDCGDGVKLELASIPAGTFVMGSPETEANRENHEVQHQVTITAFSEITDYVYPQ